MIRWVHAIDKPVSEAAYSTNTLAGPAERQVIQPRPLGIGRISSFTFFYSLVTKGDGRLMELKCLVQNHPAQDWPDWQTLVSALFYLI